MNKKVTNVDEMPLMFGKYKGRTPNDIVETDPAYIVWLWEVVEKQKSKVVSRKMYLAATDLVEERKHEKGF